MPSCAPRSSGSRTAADAAIASLALLPRIGNVF
jgi:hypothetical protein